MAENLMNGAHKASTPASREGWERTFRGGKFDKFRVGDVIRFTGINGEIAFGALFEIREISHEKIKGISLATGLMAIFNMPHCAKLLERT